MLAAAGFAVLTVVATYPLALQGDTGLPCRVSDCWLFVWDLWWGAQSLRGGATPFHTAALYHPTGANLVFTSLILPFSALYAVFASFVGVTTFYNLLQLFAVWSSAVSAYALSWRLTSSTTAAALTGVIYGFSAYRIHRLHGLPDLTLGLWLPILLLCAIQLIRARNSTVRVAAIAGMSIVLLLGTLTRPALMIGGLYIACFLMVREIGRGRLPVRQALRWLIAWAATTALIGAPYFLQLWQALPVPTPEDLAATHATRTVTLRGLLAAGHQPLLYPWAASTPSAAGPPVFLGYGLVALLALGLRRRGEGFGFWLLSGSFFLLMACGTQLSLDIDFPTTVPLPYEWLPGIASIRVPRRFFQVGLLCLAVAGGIAWSQSTKRWPRARRAAGAVALMIFLATEQLAGQVKISRPEVSPFYSTLARSERAGALIEIPQHSRRFDKLYMYYQTVHGRPIHAGHLSRLPPGTLDFIERSPLLRRLSRERRFRAEPAHDFDLATDLPMLRANGFRYMIFHKRFPGMGRDGIVDAPERFVREIGVWRALAACAEPAYDDRMLVAFDLEAVEGCEGTERTPSSERGIPPAAT